MDFPDPFSNGLFWWLEVMNHWFHNSWKITLITFVFVKAEYLVQVLSANDWIIEIHYGFVQLNGGWNFGNLKLISSFHHISSHSNQQALQFSKLYESSLLMNIQVVRISVNNHWLWGMWLTWRNFNCSTMWLVRKNIIWANICEMRHFKCWCANRLFAFLPFEHFLDTQN